ncbi:MAG: hypothetical protein U0289_06620 [Cyclobacteriaceae bacterium]|mgnify:CR=1 FL=1|nr:hypothetical protein [Cyclobacteriaceae bacterium]
MRTIHGGLFTLTLIGLLFSCQNHSSSPDNDFDVTVPEAKLTGQRVLFDEGHKNHHQIGRTYKPFATLLKNDGCKVESSDKPVDVASLSNTDILVLATATGKEEPGDKSAYTEKEISTLDEWIKNGGSVLIITEHYPFGLAMKTLLEALNVRIHNGYTEDSTLNNPQVRDALLFEKSKGNLNSSHSITTNLNRVNTFTGSSVKGDSTWTNLLILSDNAQNYNVNVKVDKEGGDVNVSVTYADFYPATGFSQGICKRYGKGKIVVLAESALLTAQFDKNGNKFGMNIADSDNKQLALNIIRWLADKNSN